MLIVFNLLAISEHFCESWEGGEDDNGGTTYLFLAITWKGGTNEGSSGLEKSLASRCN